MKYFKIAEFEKAGIKSLTPEIQRNIENLVDKILDPVRSYWGKPVYILEATGIGVLAQFTTRSREGNISCFEYIKTLGGYDELTVEGDFDSISVSIFPINRELTEEIEEEFMSDWLCCLDSGHGKDVAGKRSPDGSLLEWEWAREIKLRLMDRLTSERICPCFDVNPENTEPGLTTRATRANKAWQDNNKKGIFVSIHINAAGNGQWMNARGWSIWTTKSKTISDELATDMWYEMEKVLQPLGINMRKDMSDGDPDYEENFTVIYKTNMASVLVENLFMDNKEDLAFLKSEKGKEAILTGLFNGIKRYLEKKK